MIVRALITIPMDSGTPKDAMVNTLYFRTPGTFSDPIGDELKGYLKTLYTGLVGVMSFDVSHTQIGVKLYDMGQPPPRPPIYEELLDVTQNPAGGGTLPHELALCLSFQGGRLAGVNQARRRGRIYVGPLYDGVNNGTGEVGTAWLNIIRDAGAGLMNSCTASTNLDWIVYSKYPLPELERPAVQQVWCDDAWDVQRRRGVAATTRAIANSGG